MLETVGSPGLWAGFVALVLVFLALDLGVFHRRDEPITIRNALTWTGIWVAVSLCFNALLWWRFGGPKAAEFLTGYLIEKSLSVDNLFVFVVIFTSLSIPARLQHRVLFWGILTALGLRAAMILAGTALLQRFHWLIYVFGAFLLLTGVKLLLHRGDEAPHPEQSRAFRMIRAVIPATTRLEGHAFFLREGGRWVATPLFVALVFIELSDVVFALDSIPAIFGVTLDPFIVFTSNIFAILGLRSLYFALAGLMDRFIHLRAGLALVLLFIGGKMVAAPWVKVGQGVALLVVAGLLGGAVVLSLLSPPKPAAAPAPEPPSAAGD
ncbi:MAG: TerC family protein [Bacteroidetes bacterium]|nr:TerC family protein [Bacteroidota bacterium]